MELKDNGPEVTGGGLFKNRFAVIVAVLAGVAIIGICVLGLFIMGVLPPGKHTVAVAGQATATRITIAIATETSAPVGLNGATSVAPTATDTPVVGSTSGTPVPIATASNAVTPTAGASKPPAANVPASNAPADLYVTALRVDPAHPVKNNPINFYVTFVNPTGKPENHSLCVEIYRPGDKKSFGITHCAAQTIPTGTSELVIGSWTATGIHQCIPVRARAVSRDDHDNRYPYFQANGSDLWLDFSVCP